MTVITSSQKPLLGKLRIQSTLTIETGLHIGGGSEKLDIGGIDKPVVRDPITLQPYLPGSSLKGKLRAILERILNKPLNRSGGGVYRYESDDLDDGYTQIGRDEHPRYIRFDGARHCEISRLFGSTGAFCYILESVAQSQNLDFKTEENAQIGGNTYAKIRGRNSPARLIVRDCHLLHDSAQQLAAIDTGLYMTEWKFENSIDRITAAANPRQFERVPKGAQFQFEIVYTLEDPEHVTQDIQNLAIALAILEDDALGGHGSRGYGKVSFTNFKLFHRDLNFYRNPVANNPRLEPISSFENVDRLLQDFEAFQTQIQRHLREQSNNPNAEENS